MTIEIYFFIGFIISVIILYIIMKYFDNKSFNNTDDDFGHHMIMSFIFILLGIIWPATLIIGLYIGICKIIKSKKNGEK